MDVNTLVAAYKAECAAFEQLQREMMHTINGVLYNERWRIPEAVPSDQLRQDLLRYLKRHGISTQGVQFTTYAYTRIKGAMHDEWRAIKNGPKKGRERALPLDAVTEPVVITSYDMLLDAKTIFDYLEGIAPPVDRIQSKRMKGRQLPLPDKSWARVGLLHHREDRSLQEVGDMLGIHESSARNLERRCIAHLRERLR